MSVIDRHDQSFLTEAVPQPITAATGNVIDRLEYSARYSSLTERAEVPAAVVYCSDGPAVLWMANFGQKHGQADLR